MKKLLLLLAPLFVACGSDVNPNAIEGLEHYDVTKNFENNGFTFEKIKTEFGTSNKGTKSGNGYAFYVSSFGSDYKSVESVTADVLVNNNKTIEAGKQFFSFTATLPYENANPQEASKWVRNNYNNNRDTIIGGVKFTITAPTDLTRRLLLEKNQ